jgi:membrane fusion protein, heavy metal efflux system
MANRDCFRLAFGLLLSFPLLTATVEVAIAGAGHSHGPEFKTQDSSNAPVTIDAETARQAGISAEEVKPEPFDVALRANGSIDLSPNRQALVTPPVKGKIIALLVEPGTRVRRGDPLATIASAELADLRATTQEKRAELWATVQQAQTNLKLAESNYQRYRTIAAAELDRARDSLSAAQAQYDRDLALVRDRSVVRVARENYQRQLAIAQTEIAQAQTEVAIAQERYEQDRQLTANGALPRRQALESQAGLIAARAKLAKAQQQPQVLAAAVEIRRAEVDLPIRAQQESAARLAEAKSNLVAVSTQKDVIAAEAELQRARSALTAAQARLELADRSYTTRLRQLDTSADANGLVTIKAPIDGTVADRPATIGQTVVDGETKLMTIANNAIVAATAQIYERDLPKIAVGQSVNVRVAGLGNRLLSGTIDQIGTQVDERRTVAVRALLDNTSNDLKAGMFAELEVITGRSDRPLLSVPDSAIFENNGKKLVYVQNGNTFRPVEVTIGETAGDRLEIKAGLFAGDRVVTRGAMSLYAQSLRISGATPADNHDSQSPKPQSTSANIVIPMSVLPVAGIGSLTLMGVSLGIWQYRRRFHSASPSTLEADIDRAITNIFEKEETIEPSAIPAPSLTADMTDEPSPTDEPSLTPAAAMASLLPADRT